MTKHMVVSKDIMPDVYVPTIRFADKEVENVHSYNYLGVVVDDKLTFNGFLDTKYNKAKLCIHQWGKMRKFINGDIAITIYKQMILPLFDYANFMVEIASKPKIAKLEKLQEKALRYVDNNTCVVIV